MNIILALYRIVSTLALPLLLISLIIRAIRGKEILRRLPERLGYTTILRPKGKLLWCHAASVGEAKSAITLLRQMHPIWPDIYFLLTTGTVTSAEIVNNEIKDLPPLMRARFIHQFASLDEYFSRKRFLKHWDPCATILIESELWPNLLSLAKAYGKTALVNARMSASSFKKWSRYPTFVYSLLRYIDIIITQSERDKQTYIALGGKNVSCGPSLKLFNAKLKVNDAEVVRLKSQIGARIVITLASSHAGDEEKLLDIYVALRKKHREIFLCIAPRHINRRDEILALISKYELPVAVRSRNQVITHETAIYLCDSLGELGTIFSLSHITIIGGSFAHGGHNPVEPAVFGNMVIWGPDMINFGALATDMLASGAAYQGESTEDLYRIIDQIVAMDEHTRCSQSERTKAFVTTQANAQTQYHKLLESLIDNDKT